MKPGPDKQNNFIFQHGWGFSSAVWNAWRTYEYGGNCQFLDRGYWGRAVEPRLTNHRNVLVTHSLGLHFAEPCFAEVDCLVILSGFEHFHGKSISSGRFTHKHIKRMLARIHEDADGLLADFYRDCGCSLSPGCHPDLSLLEDDLHLLDTSHAALQKMQAIPKILLLHGAVDRIVAPDRARELNRALPGSVLEFIPQAGHGLPCTHADVCWRIIKDFL